MIYGIYGFLLGFIIPYMARRFSKFMPASAPFAILYLVIPSKKTSKNKRQNNPVYQHLKKQYLNRSLMYGLITSIIFTGAFLHFQSVGLAFILFFIWSLLLLLEIDHKTMLLPDVITIPLLIGGFLFSCSYGLWILPIESAIGSVIGYIVPTLSALLLIKKHPYAIGGGDIKLFSAIGAWLGIFNTVYVILLSCLIFAVNATLTHKRIGAFGPAICISAIIVAFYYF